MKPTLGKAFSFWIVGALAVVALLAPTTSAAAQGTGSVSASVQNCTGLSYQGLMTDVGSDCEAGSASFTFYLHGDGTDDSWTLDVSGEGSIDLPSGTYDVWTPGGPIFNVTVPDGGSTSFVYGFPVEAPVPPPTEPTPPPAAETATLNVSTYACTGVVGAPIALADIGPDCTPISTNLDFYLWGDGTDASWNLSTSADGPVAIELQVGGYDVVNTSTWETVGTQLPSGGASLAIGYAAVAPDPPAPTPETATLEVSTYACTGVVGAPIALGEIGPDCTPISTNVDFYLWGDGSDASWNLTTSADGPVTIDLAVGGYQVVDTTTWATLGTQVPSGGASLAIGYAAEPAPPVVETAVMNVEVYSCTGVTGTAIVLGEIGPDCVRVSTDLEFYLWGDGTDDHATLTTDANGTVAVELPVGGYEVWDVTTWQKVGVNVPAEGGTVAIGIPAADFGVTP